MNINPPDINQQDVNREMLALYREVSALLKQLVEEQRNQGEVIAKLAQLIESRQQ